MLCPETTRRCRAWCFASVFALAAVAAGSTVLAHEVGAAKVSIRFTLDGRYRIDAALFMDHLPAQAEGESPDPSAIRAQLIGAARILFDGVAARPLEMAPGAGPADPRMTAGGVAQVLVHFEGPIPGGVRSFAWRLDLPIGIYLVGTRDDGGEATAWQWVQGGAASEPVALLHAPPAPTRWQVARSQFALGFSRVLPFGLDLGLFALAWFFLSPRPRAVLAQVVAFAAAHAIALGLALSGVVTLGPHLAAPLVALAVAYVAVDNLAADRLKLSRLAVVFAFGLVYGAGCADVFRATGSRRADLATAVVAFTAGGAAGQLVVVGLAFLAVGAWLGRKSWYRPRLSVPASAVIAIVGLLCTIWRILPVHATR